MGGLLCVVSPGTCAASIGKSTFNDLFMALTSWIVSSVQWLLSAAGNVLTSASEPTTVLRAAQGEFATLLVLSAPLLLIGLLVSTLQALRHGDAMMLWRTYLGVAPACVLTIFLARPVALLILEAVNQMSTNAASAVAAHESVLATNLLAVAPSTPGFGLFLLGVAVVVGSWLLWCELIVRTVILTLLLVMVPVVVPLSLFPSLRRIAWRLGETFCAVAASKFVIVVTLALGLSELDGTSRTEVLSGALTLALAACTPYVIIRLMPVLEQSALHAAEGVRARATRSVTNLPTSPVVGALGSLTPNVEVDGPAPRSDDLGLSTWPGEGETPLAPMDGDPPPPPVGTPRRRGGHVAYRSDDGGPVVGWHFDE